jgi:YegS/Rv2252/BmrU family lipid kinase
MKTLLFLYNPHAGKGQAVAALGEICAAFQAEGYLVTVYATKARGDAVEVARTMAGHYDRFVCCGGDGTLSEVISGLIASGNHLPLGYIPAGTTNDFAKTLRIPTAMGEAATLAASGPAFPIDIGRLNEHQFNYVAAFGLFTAVSYETPQEFKNLLGHGAYVLEGIRSLSEIATYQMQIDHDGQTLEGEFLYGMVSNSVSVGGFPIDLGANPIALDDGQFEVTLVRKPESLAEVQSIVDAFRGRGAHGSMVSFRAKQLTVTCADAVPWTVDGEYGGSHCYADISALHHAVSIVAGEGIPVVGERN